MLYIFLTNYRGIDLLPLKVPTLLREPQLGLMKNHFTPVISIVFVPKGSLPYQSLKYDDEYSATCSFSTFFVNAIGTHCLQLKFIQFTMKSKPQMCLLNVALYPQDYVFYEYGKYKYKLPSGIALDTMYHHPFVYNVPHEVLDVSSVVKPVNILIWENVPKQRQEMDRHNLYRWLVSMFKGYVKKWNHQMVKDLFILVKTKTAKTENAIVSQILSPKIITIDLRSKVINSSSVRMYEISSKLWQLDLSSILSIVPNTYKSQLIIWYSSGLGQSGYTIKFKTRTNSKCILNPHFFAANHRPSENKMYDVGNLFMLYWHSVITMVQGISYNATIIDWNGAIGRYMDCLRMPSGDEVNTRYTEAFIQLGLETSPTKNATVPLTLNNPFETYNF